MRTAVMVTLAMFGVLEVAAADDRRSTDTPTPAGLDSTAFAKLMTRAKESNTDAIVIYKDGTLLGEWYFDRPRGRIEAMSATKSIVSLAIGRLIDQKKITSLDQPVADFYPEWRQGKKQLITIRHLLAHTSGLQNASDTNVEIYPSPDFVKLALAAEMVSDPGTQFAYNNKAVNLLAGIIKIAARVPMDTYIRDQIFAPLGIKDVAWTRDAAGNPHAMSGLQIRAADLAKIGQLLLDGGEWKGKRIVSEDWIAASTQAQSLNPKCGLLWWLQSEFRSVIADEGLLAIWKKGGASASFLAKVTPLKDKVFTDRKAYFAALEAAFGGKAGLEEWHDNTWRKQLPDGKALPAPVVSYYADGFLGQYLVVVPRDRLVAVRQMRAPQTEGNAKLDTFAEFPQLVTTLVTR